MSNILQFKSKAQLEGESFQKDVEDRTGIKGRLMTHDEIMAVPPEEANAAIRVYQKHHRES